MGYILQKHLAKKAFLSRDLPKALIPFCGNVGQVDSKALLARQWVICVVIQPVMRIWKFQESNFDGHGFSELFIA